MENLVSFHCKGCGELLFKGNEACFYQQYSSGIHLNIKYEYQNLWLLDENSKFKIIDQTNPARVKIAPKALGCIKCNASVANLCFIGPLHEQTPCFNNMAIGVKKNGEDFGHGKWSTLSKFLPEIEVRNIENFYGSAGPDKNFKSNFLVPPTNLNKPTDQNFKDLNLRELSATKPRSYQIECFCAAAMANTVVYLPTGAGKTLVASMLVSFYHKLNPNKTAVMIVHRVPLAFQQGQYIREETGLEVLVASGEMTEDIPKRRLVEFGAIVCTAQILINWIKRGYFRMEDVSVLIFDEVHNAVKGHNYVVLLKDFYACVEELYRPLCVGLTASPVGGDVLSMTFNLEELCKKIMGRVFMPCLFYDEMCETINRPQVEYHLIEDNSEVKAVSQLIDQYCQVILSSVSALIDVPVVSLPSDSASQTRGFLRALQQQASEQNNDALSELVLHLQQAFSCHEINSVLGSRHVHEYLREISTRVQHIPETVEIVKKLAEFSSRSPKLEDLLAFLESIESGPQVRVLMFVQTKRTARWLLKAIREHDHLREKWKPELFVGKSATEPDGMKWLEEQEPVLQRFRVGQHQLLVSTDVLQEGIDVPVCNHVIMFDQTWSLTSFIQARGRARSHQSAYTLICSEEQKKKYEKLVDSESLMQEAITRSMAKNKTLSVGLVFVVLILKHQASTVHTNWVSVKKVAGEQNETAVLGRLYSLSICLHRAHADPAILDLFSQLPLKSLEEKEQQDEVFPDSNCVVVTAEFSRQSTMFDFLKHAPKLCQIASQKDTLLSFRTGKKISGVENFFAIADNLDLGALVTPTKFEHLLSMVLPFKFMVSMRESVLRLFFVINRLYRIEIDLKMIDRFVVLDIDDSSKLSLFLPLKQTPYLFCSDAEAQFVDVKLSNLDNFGWERVTFDQLPNEIDRNALAEFTTLKLDFFLNAASKASMISSLSRLEVFSVLYGNVSIVEKSPVPLHWQLQSFSKCFALQTLLSSAFWTLSCRITQEFVDLVQKVDEPIIYQLLFKLTENRFADPLDELQKLLDRSVEDKIDTLIFKEGPRNTSLVRFIIITPTRLVFQPPKSMTRNRILRAFNPDYFVRVQFRDEDMHKLSSVKHTAGIKTVLDRFLNLLMTGIVIGDLKFDFLAMSSSQLRDHGCWFVAPHLVDGVTIDAEYIRKWCGNFSSIRSVAKYVARLGQSLSASNDTVKVSPYDYEIIPDIERNGFNFTDGIGMISPALVQDVCQRMKLDPQPTAFQIRFGGFKGVLATSPLISGDEKKLWLRKSMRKFESEHYVLEVLNISQYIPCYLNRQVIMIISALGVSDQVLVELQDRMFKRLSSMLVDNKVSQSQISSHYYFLPKVTVDCPTEPFMRSLLLAIYRKQLGELLTKSRVFVPRGRILMGNIDETCSLKPNQVFIQVRRHPDDDPGLSYTERDGCFIVLGPVVIAKNPCLHPGDARIMEAIDLPALHRTHIDVLVFPATGDRPVTDMCSGSDLDGDLYFCSWEPSLIPSQEHEPMDYTPPGSVEVEEVTVDHMKHFVVDFISNDQLGTIANSHVAQVDVRPGGVSDEMCKALAFLFSFAVDFPKTGFIPSFPKEAKVQSWPDFMQKVGQPSHISTKVIGRMFRKAKLIKPNPIFKEISLDNGFLAPGYEEFLPESKELYQKYAESLANILCLYGVKNESQVFSGALIENGVLGKDDIKEAMEVMGAKIKTLVKHFRSVFDQNPNAQRASSWYYAAYNEPLKCGLDSPILSFPWIVGDYLVANNNVQPKNHASVANVLGRNIVREAIEILSDDFVSVQVERVNFFNLLKSNLKSMLSIDIALVGSTASGIGWSVSDVNMMVIDRGGVSFSEIFEQVSKMFRVILTDNRIEYNGHPFSFTICDFDEDVLKRSMAIKSLLEDQKRFVIVMILLKWARSHNIIRNSRHHQGKMTATQFVESFYPLEYHKNYEIDASSEIDWHSKMLGKLREMHNYEELSDELMKKFHYWGFDHVEENLLLSEKCFQAFHLVCESLNPSALWDPALLVDTVDQEIVMAKKPKLMRKPGGSSMFMEGCSVMLMEQATCNSDPISFDLYQQRRRPQHLTAQCFVPVLKTENRNSAKLYNDYVAHAFRQFDLARRCGSSEWGLLKGTIKMGHLYLTNLPKMFVDDGMSANVESVQKALQMGYKSISNSKSVGTICGSDQVHLEPVHKEFEEAEETHTRTTQEIVEDASKVKDKIQKSMLPQAKKKQKLSAMSSSFEPFMTLDKHDFLQNYGFFTEGDPQAGYSISIDFYEALCGLNREFQFIYDEEMNFVRSSFRPIKWMLADIKSNSQNEFDLRLALSTTKNFPLEAQSEYKGIEIDHGDHQSFPDLIKKGIVKKQNGQLIVCEAFRDSEHLFARHSITEKYKPSPLTMSKIYNFIETEFPQFPIPSETILSKIRISLISVTEYSDHDNQTGQFTNINEKIEMELILPLEWNLIDDVGKEREIIQTIWLLGQFLKKSLQSQ